MKYRMHYVEVLSFVSVWQLIVTEEHTCSAQLLKHFMMLSCDYVICVSTWRTSTKNHSILAWTLSSWRGNLVQGNGATKYSGSLSFHFFTKKWQGMAHIIAWPIQYQRQWTSPELVMCWSWSKFLQNSSLQNLNKPLSQCVHGWMVRWALDVLDAIVLHEISKFRRNKMGAIIQNNMLWQCICS